MRIERIGTALGLPGIHRIEWHEAAEPDGRFVRLPLPDVILTINLGVVGHHRRTARGAWRPFPRIALRGVCTVATEGRDPPTGAVSYLSVVLAPWAVRAYLGVGAAVLADCIVDATRHAPGLTDLARRLALVADAHARLDLVTAWLRSRFDADGVSSRSRVVLDALRDDVSVTEIARRCGITARRVHQVCVAECGLNPSTYRQVARFAQLVTALHVSHAADTHAVLLGGYADQSHAIRAFRRLAGTTPRRYRDGRVLAPRTYSIMPIPSAADGAPSARRRA